MHLASAPPPLRDHLPDVPQLSPLQELLDVGLAKQPELRFASAAEYLTKIEQLLDAGWQGMDQVVSVGAKSVSSAAVARSATTSPGVPPPSATAQRLSLRSKLLIAISLLVLGVALWQLYGKVRP